MIIAIDGPAGAGKSTVGKAVAHRLGLQYLDTGAMYRAVAFAALRQGVPVADVEATADVARAMDLAVADDGRVTVNGEDATTAIRGREVTESVSAVAGNTPVREELRARRRVGGDGADGLGHLAAADRGRGVLAVDRHLAVVGHGEVHRPCDLGRGLDVGDGHALAQRGEGDGPVHRAGVEVPQAEPARHRFADRALARSGGAVDGDDHQLVPSGRPSS